MSKWEENSILIERYLDGDLTEQEKLSFEKIVAEDAKLLTDFELQKQIRKDIRMAEERRALRNTLNEFHQTYFSYPGSTETKVIQFKKRSIISIVSIAASISLVVTVGSLAIYHYGFKKLKKNQEYAEVDRPLSKENTNTENKSAANKDEDKNSMLENHSRAATAFALSSDGWVITSYHTVKDENNVTLEMVGDSLKSFTADVRFFDRNLDVALLKITDKNFKGFGKIPYSFTDGNAVLAQEVFALGYPKDDIVFAQGTISSFTGFNMDTLAYQAGIAINPGNSGAPLFNTQGDVIGIIAGKNMKQDGASYAIKAKYFLRMLKHIELPEAEGSINLPSKNLLKGKKTTEQVKMIAPFVFIIKA